MDSIKVSSLFDLSKTIAEPIFESATYAWEILGEISSFIVKLGSQLPLSEYERAGKPEDNIWISKTAAVAPTASITGPCIIDHGAEVRHCAYIRGSAIVGKNAVAGNSTELKNVILFDSVQVPHYNYVGDSILGYKSHMGAGAITSNVKADKNNVTVTVNEERIDTGRKKLGAILGDLVEVGCNSVLNPGTVIGPRSTVYPLSMVRGYVPADSIYKCRGEVIKKENR